MNTLPLAFIAAAIAMITGQCWKIISPVFRGKPPIIRNALQSGGMPSSHTAATASMALVIGFHEGFNSSVFAVALVLTTVVAHDAVRVRGSINTIINILKKAAPQEFLDEEDTLPETIGHSVKEVVAGFVLAGIVTTGFLLFYI
ncbi:MAG: hypothetical protein DRP70_05820 [Spirochaetes bacterium]|nr:MAG: hypothetical protein DRP70_05820 [Spirochaetota bacterium]